MNTKYDKNADALYMKFNKGKVSKTLRLDDKLIVDLDSKSNVIGIELLNASNQLTPKMNKQIASSISNNLVVSG